MADRSVAILVHAEAKVGKTTFSGTGPKPLLFIDAENSSKFLAAPDGSPYRQIKWDPMTSAPPTNDGTWDVCVVKARQWNIALKTYEYLKTDRHPFKTVVIDSLTEIQDKAKKEIKPDVGSPMKMQEWGLLLESMGSFCRNIRDLTDRETSPIQAIILITTSKPNKEGKMKPGLQGSLAKDIPYLYDVTGYLFVRQFKDEQTKQPYEVRTLWTQNHPLYEAGTRTRLPKEIFYPNVQNILDQLFGPEVDNQAPVA